MKKLIITLIYFFAFVVINAQNYNQNLHLKDYAGDVVITSQVRAERNKAILRGTESTKNREFVLANYTGIQPSVYPGFNNGFWPKDVPENINNIKFNTSHLDELVNWGVQNNFHIIHHCLFFPNKYFPDWFSNSNYSQDDLNRLLVNYISGVLNANDNKHKIDVFNVINEIFDFGQTGKYRDNGDGNEDCKWMGLGYEKDRSGLMGESKINIKHPIFVRKVFETAGQLSEAKLEIRDFNVAFGGKKADGLYQLVRHLLNSGVRVDAVGFQCHLNTNKNYNYDNFKKNVERFLNLGVEVYITELDVGLNLWNNGKKKIVEDILKTDKDWELFFKKQKDIYYNIILAAKTSGVSLISDWGFRDDIPYGNWRKNQKAWLIKKDYSKKEAYYAVLKALHDADLDDK
jgi:endo-1,4-beta-xylanase